MAKESRRSLGDLKANSAAVFADRWRQQGREQLRSRRSEMALVTKAVVCEAVEDSRFFDHTFDGDLAWGLMFLLSPEDQRHLIGEDRRDTGSGRPAAVYVSSGTDHLERCDDGIGITLPWSRGVPSAHVSSWALGRQRV